MYTYIIGGASYIRWGRTDCPSNLGTVEIYSGIMAGALFNQAGGGSSFLCLPETPQYFDVSEGVDEFRGYVYHTEYHSFMNPPALGSLFEHNAPCALCFTPERLSKIMIPGSTSCPTSWTLEYEGYLMTERSHPDHHRNSYECVDRNAVLIPGTETNNDGALLHFTETRCGTQCPNYTDGYELACVVCTI